MVKLLIRLVIIAFSLWVAAQLVDGITLEGGIVGILIVSIIFGLINAIVKPIVKLLSLPFIILTLGLFIIVINVILFWLTSVLTGYLTVDGFWAYVWGALIVSVVSWLLNMFVSDD